MSVQKFDRLKSGFPRLISMLNLAIGAVLVISILVLARDVISLSGKKMAKPATPAQATALASKKSFQDYAPVVRNNPFGPPGELKPLYAATTNQSAPKSDMTGLTLAGTVSGPRKYSYAIFVDKSGNQEVYRIGDTVPGYGVLQKVEKDKVLIKSGGAPVEIPVADFVSIVDASSLQSSKPATFAKNVGEGSYVVDQKRVQQAIEKPNQIMTDARMLPNVIDGKQQGFMLSEVKPGGIYQSLGLQNGDVLLRINEFSISNPESALQAFTALRGMDRVQLDIMRNGARVSMTYQIR
jgi:general secretion pathway protein C